MFKLYTMACGVVLMFGVSAMAEDLFDSVGELDLSQVNDAISEVEEFDLGSLDVDRLAAGAGEESKKGDEAAIEACFRRIGWSSYCGYSSCWYPSFSYGYSHSVCYPSYYSYSRPISYVCRPICRPVYPRYWGCY